MKIRVLIVDDYFLIREGIKRSLKALREVVVVGEASDTKQIAVLLATHQPNIILMEMNLCDRPIKDLISEIRQGLPYTNVLIVSGCFCELPILISIRLVSLVLSERTYQKKSLRKRYVLLR